MRENRDAAAIVVYNAEIDLRDGSSNYCRPVEPSPQPYGIRIPAGCPYNFHSSKKCEVLLSEYIAPGYSALERILSNFLELGRSNYYCGPLGDLKCLYGQHFKSTDTLLSGSQEALQTYSGLVILRPLEKRDNTIIPSLAG